MRSNVKTKNAAALSLFNKNVYKSLVTRDYFERKTYLLRPKSWVILQERHGYCQEDGFDTRLSEHFGGKAERTKTPEA